MSTILHHLNRNLNPFYSAPTDTADDSSSLPPLGPIEQIKSEIQSTYRTIRYMNRRTFAQQLLSLLLIVSTAVMIWKSLIVMTGM